MDDVSLRGRLRAALPPAMKSKDRAATSALRSTLAAIDNAEAVPTDQTAGSQAIEQVALGVGATETARRDLTDGDVEQIVRTEIAERESAAEQYARAGRTDRADQLRQEAQVLAGHLT